MNTPQNPTGQTTKTQKLEKLNEAIKTTMHLFDLHRQCLDKLDQLLLTLRYQRELLLLGIHDEDVWGMIKTGNAYFGVVTKDNKQHAFRNVI